MNNHSLAPVVLFTYNRPDHTAKVLEALSNNHLAKESNLYIFCDGPKNEKTIETNKLVRQIIHEEKWKECFRSVTVVESEVNKGLANSIISGVTDVLNIWGKCIVLEDDLLTSKYFLTYMNHALNYYSEDHRIWSVTGFSFNLSTLKKYDHDVYLSYRANSHSWGTWKDRWDKVDWDVSDFDMLCRSPAKIARFNRGGNDLFRMLRHQMRGERDSWAIRFCYSQSKNDMYTVYPKYSFVKNIGFDGTGTHCQKGELIDYSNFAEDLSSMKFESVNLDKRITAEFKRMYRISAKEAGQWLLNRMRRLFRQR